MEALTATMAELHRMNTENMSSLLKANYEAMNQLVGNTKTTNLTDSRGICRPIMFKGDERKYAEWKAKLMAYLRVATPRSDELIHWALNSATPIAEEDMDLKYPDHKQDILKYTANLYSVLLSCTEDDAFRICHSVKDGNGLEA